MRSQSVEIFGHDLADVTLAVSAVMATLTRDFISQDSPLNAYAA